MTQDNKDTLSDRQEIISFYFEENKDRKNDPYFTWLSFILKDWRTVKQYSTDMIQPYSYIKE